MSSTVQRKPARYEDVLSAPDHVVAEILDGELFTSPRPSFRHARAAWRLGVVVSRFEGPGGGGESPGGWWFLDEPELHFDDDVVVPDIAGWRCERVPEPPDVAWFDVAPDWLCEVISPSTESVDRGRKLHIYARAGVSHVWLLNPLAKLLELYRLTEGSWVLVKSMVGNDPVRVEPFDAIEMDMSRWWLPDVSTSNET